MQLYAHLLIVILVWEQSSIPEEIDMNKKIFDIAYACFSLFLMLAFGIVVARAQHAQTRGGLSVFIPGFYKSPSGHTIEGRVVGLQNMPISGITIRTNRGQSVVTDKNGEYAIEGLAIGS